MTLSFKKSSLDEARPVHPLKAELQRQIMDPENDPFTPMAQLHGRSPIGFALFGANREDLGDGLFAYEREDGLAALDVILPRMTKAPSDPDQLQQYRAALAVWRDARPNTSGKGF